MGKEFDVEQTLIRGDLFLTPDRQGITAYVTVGRIQCVCFIMSVGTAAVEGALSRRRPESTGN
jgi:hypothetical protein